MPEINIPPKCRRILTTKARIVVLIGGRSSAKSETMGRLLLMKAQTEGADILCGREYQNSIDDSVHKLLKTLIKEIPIKKTDVTGFDVTDNVKIYIAGGDLTARAIELYNEHIKSETLAVSIESSLPSGREPAELSVGEEKVAVVLEKV